MVTKDDLQQLVMCQNVVFQVRVMLCHYQGIYDIRSATNCAGCLKKKKKKSMV